MKRQQKDQPQPAMMVLRCDTNHDRNGGLNPFPAAMRPPTARRGSLCPKAQWRPDLQLASSSLSQRRSVSPFLLDATRRRGVKQHPFLLFAAAQSVTTAAPLEDMEAAAAEQERDEAKDEWR
ncbi:hypothetical protein S245_024610 [Arachis hypogaea]